MSWSGSRVVLRFYADYRRWNGVRTRKSFATEAEALLHEKRAKHIARMLRPIKPRGASFLHGPDPRRPIRAKEPD